MQMTDPRAIRAFIRGGKAVFTIVSKKTGTRFTYKVQVAKDNQSLWFVSLLTGSDNTGDYTYMGTIREGVGYGHGRKSSIDVTAPSARAFEWFHAQLYYQNGEVATSHAEFFHEGRCCRCARTLTVPASIKSGIGPECAGKAGGFYAEAA